MKKRLFFSILSIMLIFALFSPCLAEASVADNALPVFLWERSGAEHWKQSASGEKTDVGAHTFDGANCTVCGSEVWRFDDGSADVSDYNDHGDLTRYTSFDGSGKVIIEICYAYEYDAEGRMLLSREFTGDVLTGEVTYTVNDSGETIPVSQVAYYDDDTWAINEYDEHGNLIHTATYETDGTISFEEFSEYALSTEGYYYESSKTSLFADGASFYHEYNEYSDPIRTLNMEADGTVWEDAAYEYQYENGMMLWKKQYSSGVLTQEFFYNEEGLATRETEFFDDGAKMTTEYNAFSDPVIITFYTADGSVEMVQTYEYEYNEDMTRRLTRAYTDGMLVIQTEYATEDGWSYACRETLYDADDSFIVYEFNSQEEIISETSYDAQGNLIQ